MILFSMRTPDFTLLFSTFFYVGFFPFAPGSLASLITLFLSVFLIQNIFLYLILFFGVTFVGFVASDKMEKKLNQKDPSCIVIDEVAGALVAFFLLPVKFSVLMTAFFLFRAFDMFKIYPINKLELLSGGKGVMLDDLLAGLYTNLTIQLALRLAGMS